MTRHVGKVIFFSWWRHIISNKSFVRTIMMILRKSNASSTAKETFLLLMFLLFLSSTFDGLLAGVCHSFSFVIWFLVVSSISTIVLIECVAKQERNSLARRKFLLLFFEFQSVLRLSKKKIKSKFNILKKS